VISLVLAGVFSFFIGEKIDAIAILIIVIVNGVLGFFQEFKAEKSLEALKKIETLKARVIRDGEEITVDAETIVPGDVLMLYEGEKIAADARLIEVYSLNVDESMLTGESLPVSKKAAQLKEKLALADRKNMVYSSCLVTKGRAKAIAIDTGMNTEIGRIAKEIQEAPSVLTPLQKALGKLGKILGIICLAVAIPGLILGLLTHRDWVEMIMMAISLAVSAIPEGLPIVVTIALALGIRRMAKVNVLIRKLSTAESLGSTDVICSDKTGTITHNQMTVSSVFLPKIGFFKLSGQGYTTTGKVAYDKEESKKYKFKLNNPKSVKVEQSLTHILESSVLCSDATVDFGDPTERALVVALHKIGGDDKILKKNHPRIDEVPFDSALKYMTVKVVRDKEDQVIVKGAAEVVLNMCKLSAKAKNEALAINDYISSKGLRVLAVATKILDKKKKEDIALPADCQLLGLVGMFDPPRKEVPPALKICKQAGIRVLMLTGDHKKTAAAIAKNIGLKTSKVVTGVEIDDMSDQEFSKVIKQVNVFARVSPPHKVKILTTLQSLGHQVAMTGDGVNDAPAVKRADVGISVGSGTDLTKGISDMILLDDNFSTITKGIKEGRRIFFNIKKFVRFLISANFDEIAEIFTCILFSIPLSFLPLQILWLNLATDSFPALALTSDVADKNIMSHKPYSPQKEIMKGVIKFSIMAGIIAYVATFGLYLVALYVWHLPVDHARTLAFTTTVFFEFFLAFAIRSEKSAFSIGIFSNMALWFAVLFGVVGQLIIIYHPLGQEIFKTVALGSKDWLMIVTCSSSGFVVIELLKYIKEKAPRVGRFIPIG
jgi:P-type Ca2+ transporter type 2C